MTRCNAGSIRVERATVLIVEDDDLVRAGLCGWLAATFPNCRFLEASTGEGAVDLVRVQAPDIVLMDISLPGMNGIEATRRIKAIAQQARVVILSILENPEYRGDAAAAGASAYVPKRKMHTELIPSLTRLLPQAGAATDESYAER